MPQDYRWIDDRDRPRDRRHHGMEDDFGQADYSTDYAYDDRYRTAYRVPEEEAGYRGDYEGGERPRHRRGYEAEGDYHYVGGRERPRRPRHPDDERYERREARRHRDDDRHPHDDERRPEPRSWMDQAREGVASFFGADEEHRSERRYRQGRVLWATIEGRLDHERDLDASDIEVIVDGSEVTLNGTVRSREEKRRAEDLAEVRGVSDIRNNLRIRGNRGWWR